MEKRLDSRAIAERIRVLIGGDNVAQLQETAARLGVSERAIRLSIDKQRPNPTPDVLAAVVRAYGVDPTWLLYGEYDSASHALALEAGAAFTTARLLALATSPRVLKPDEQPPRILRPDV